MFILKIKDRVYKFKLSLFQIINLDDKYKSTGGISRTINTAVFWNDNRKMLSIMEDIVEYSWMKVNGDYDEDICDDFIYRLVQDQELINNFIKSIFPDGGDMEYYMSFDKKTTKQDELRQLAHNLNVLKEHTMDLSWESEASCPTLYTFSMYDYQLANLSITDLYSTKNHADEMNSYNNKVFLDGPRIGKTVINEMISKYSTPRNSGRYSFKEENNNMNSARITKVITHNDRVVIVKFSDGSFTKAVCSENDHFDLDVGIQVCLMKKMLGNTGYYKTMKDVHKMMDDQEEAKAKAAEEKKLRREKQQKKKEKSEKKRQAHIDQYKCDIADAVAMGIEAYHTVMPDAREDDLK